MYFDMEAQALDPMQSGCRLRCHVSELLDSSRSRVRSFSLPLTNTR
jgi:hypothetical protein